MERIQGVTMLRRYVLVAAVAATSIVCCSSYAQEQPPVADVAQTSLPSMQSPSPAASSPPASHPIVQNENTPFSYKVTPSGKRVPWNSPGAIDLSYNFKHPAQFPPSAVRAHHQGRVIVLVHVDANGVVTDVRVESSSG